jgi:hypothetical protein
MLAIVALVQIPYSRTVTETTSNNLTVEIRQYIILSEAEYFIIFMIIAVVGIFIGMFFFNLHHSWTYLDLINKMENPIKINDAILALQQKKFSLGSKLPDPVKVIIKQHEVKEK